MLTVHKFARIVNKKSVLFTILLIAVLISIIIWRRKEGMESTSSVPISIIYYAYLKKDRWPYIVLPQMEDLIKNELLQHAVNMHICLSGDPEDVAEAETKIKDILVDSRNKIHFHHTYENLFEYPGLKKLYDEAISHPEYIFLYFHSKGMVFHEANTQRNEDEKVLFKTVIDAWQQVIPKFNKKDVHKVTFGCSESGVAYYNFFWVRGKYFQRCKSPEKTNDRYYYENYLGECSSDKTLNGAGECHSLVSNDATTYSNSEILTVMNNKLNRE